MSTQDPLSALAKLTPNDIALAEHACAMESSSDNSSAPLAQRPALLHLAYKLGIHHPERQTSADLCLRIHWFINARDDYLDRVENTVAALPPDIVITHVVPLLIQSLHPAYFRAIAKSVQPLVTMGQPSVTSVDRNGANQSSEWQQRPTINDAIHCKDTITPCLLNDIQLLELTTPELSSVKWSWRNAAFYPYDIEFDIEFFTMQTNLFNNSPTLMVTDLNNTNQKIRYIVDKQRRMEDTERKSDYSHFGGDEKQAQHAFAKERLALADKVLRQANRDINAWLTIILNSPGVAANEPVLRIEVLKEKRDALWEYLPKKAPDGESFSIYHHGRLENQFEWTAGELRQWFRRAPDATLHASLAKKNVSQREARPVLDYVLNAFDDE